VCTPKPIWAICESENFLACTESPIPISASPSPEPGHSAYADYATPTEGNTTENNKQNCGLKLLVVWNFSTAILILIKLNVSETFLLPSSDEKVGNYILLVRWNEQTSFFGWSQKQSRFRLTLSYQENDQGAESQQYEIYIMVKNK